MQAAKARLLIAAVELTRLAIQVDVALLRVRPAGAPHAIDRAAKFSLRLKIAQPVARLSRFASPHRDFRVLEAVQRWQESNVGGRQPRCVRRRQQLHPPPSTVCDTAWAPAACRMGRALRATATAVCPRCLNAGIKPSSRPRGESTEENRP